MIPDGDQITQKMQSAGALALERWRDSSDPYLERAATLIYLAMKDAENQDQQPRETPKILQRD